MTVIHARVPLFVVVLGVIIGGAILGLVARVIFARVGPRGRKQLSPSATVMAGITGAGIGSLVIYVATGRPATLELPATALAAIPGTVLAYYVAMRFTQQPEPTAAELVAAGESAHVEFKQTARYSVRTKQREEHIEAAVAKTVAGYLNARGGVLLIGVDDRGAVVGIEPDLPFMKQPNADRYELWLTDYLARVLGSDAIADLQVSFPRVDGVQICAVRAFPAKRPVFARLNKGSGPSLYVRVGNSTRELSVDQAVAYCGGRFGSRAMQGPRRRVGRKEHVPIGGD